MARETKEPDWAKDDTGHLTSAPAAGGAGFSSSAAEIFRLPPLLSSSDPDIAPSQIAYSGKQGALVAALASAGSAEARIKLICGPDADQRSLFHWASAGGHDELLKTLLASAREAGLGHEQIVTVLNRGDEAGMTPLSSAAAAGSVSCIDILLAYGADANTSNKGGQLPLHYHKGRAAVVAALLPVTRDINAADKAGATALHRAAGPGFLATVEALLAGGARIGCRDRWVHLRHRLRIPQHRWLKQRFRESNFSVALLDIAYSRPVDLLPCAPQVW